MADAVISVSLDPAFARLLKRQEDLQTFLLGKKPMDLDPKEMSDYIRTQAFALVAEVVEATDETHWKPWSVRPDGEEMIPSHKRFVGELADAYIFLMNLMLVGGVVTAELALAVQAKQDKNLDRWQSGYNAKTTKCRGCGRSFDDEGVKCYSSISAEETGSLPVFAFCAEKERFIDAEGNPVGEPPRVPSRVQARDEPCADPDNCDLPGHKS